MLSAGKHPKRHLHAALLDLILAAAAMAADSGAISFENPGWDQRPDGLWPGLAMVVLLGAPCSDGKHRQQR